MNLKVDYAFKRFFGDPKSRGILIAFLNATLGRTGCQEITDVELLNPELLPLSEIQRGARLDLYVRTQAGTHINIEVQIANQFNMAKRTLFYWATLYHAQSRHGLDFNDLAPTITINIVNFSLFDSTEQYHTSYHVVEDNSGTKLSDSLEIHFLELPKLRRARRNNWALGMKNPIEKWLLLLDAHENSALLKEVEMMALTDPLMEEALQVWKQMSEDPDNWPYYISRHKFLMDQISWQNGMERTEVARLKAETAQAEAETARAEAETARAQAETARLKAERAEIETKYRDMLAHAAELDTRLRQLQSEMRENQNRLEEVLGAFNRNHVIVRDFARMLLETGATLAEIKDRTGLTEVDLLAE